MKIGIICNPWLGGAGALPTELGKELAERGHSVHFIAFFVPFRLIGPWRKHIYFHKVESLEYPAFNTPPDILTMANEIFVVAQREKIQILNAHYGGVNSAAIYLARGMLRKRGQEVKIINTLHGTDVSVLGDEPIFKDVMSYLLQSSDGVNGVSRSLSEAAKKKYNLKLVKTIYNFVNTNEFRMKPSKESELRKVFAQKDEKIIVHSSNFRSIKRIQDVVEVFNLINKKIRSKLLLIGEGPDQTVATKLAAKYKIIDRIHFLGVQSTIHKLLSISDLFLLPSEKENFSLSALEAMACGVPVISSNVGGMPEMIRNGKDGFLFDVGDVENMATKGIEILSDKKLYDQMAKSARERIEKNFSQEIIVPQYEEYFKKILGEK